LIALKRSAAARRMAGACLGLAAVGGCLDFHLAGEICEDGGRCSPYWNDAGADAGLDAGPPTCCTNASLCPIPRLIASGQNQPQAIVMNGWVYWVTLGGEVWSVLPDGGSLRLVGAGMGPSRSLAVSNNYVFWSADGGILRVNLDGGNQTMLVGDPGVGDIVVDSTMVYWDDFDSVRKIPQANADGGPFSAPIRCIQFTRGLQVDSQDIYWAYGMPPSGLIESAYTDGTNRTPLARNTDPMVTTIDPAFVYWATRPDDAGIYDILRTPKHPDASVQTAELLASGTGAVSAIVVDANAVYWLVPKAGLVMTVPLDGGPPSCLESGLPNPLRLAQDPGNLYWADDLAEEIFRLPKIGP
jgi:hypothetical protein